MWEYPLPAGFDADHDMGTFYKMPNNEPIDLLVRVYVVRAQNLHPMDPNGKADPYLVCSLGKSVCKVVTRGHAKIVSLRKMEISYLSPLTE